jgi:transposase
VISFLMGREVAMARGLMSDAEWAFFEPFLRGVRAPQGRRGRDHRRALDGVFWIARTGSAWRDLPDEFGKWSSVYRQFRRWTLAGLWEAILEALNEGAASAPDNPPDRLQMIDSTIVRAHQHAAGARGALRVRVLGALEVARRPRSISASMRGGCRCAPTSRPARRRTIAASTS